MTRTPAAWTTLILGLALAAPAKGEDPPPLVPPVDAKPAVAPLPPAPPLATKPPDLAPSLDNRPILALPGINAPNSRSGRRAPTVVLPPSLSPDQTDALPPLISPIAPSSGSGGPALPEVLPSHRFRPKVVESVPRELVDEPVVLEPIDKPSSRPSGRKPGTSPPVRDLPAPRAFDEATGNRSRFLNRLMPSRGGSSGNAVRPEPESGISTEPRSDPAADTALKRKIEREADQSVGKKVKSIDVMVVGRIVTVQVKGVKFWQKRAVRHSLEGLPGLNGYKSVIDVRD